MHLNNFVMAIHFGLSSHLFGIYDEIGSQGQNDKT